MNDVIRAAAALQSACEAEGWEFCFIGGLAVQRWGEPRETVDAPLAELKEAPEIVERLAERRRQLES